MDLIGQFEFDNDIQVCELETNADFEAFQFMNDIAARAQYKKLVTPKTFRSKKKRFDSLVAAHNPENLNDFLEGKVFEKITGLATYIAHLKTG